MHATTFGALGEPSRLRIVELLRQGPLSVGDIAASLGIRQPQVSKHLRVLGEVQMVSAEWSERKRIYHLQSEPFEAIGSWVESFEGTWEARLDSLGEYLRSGQQQLADAQESTAPRSQSPQPEREIP